MELRRDDAHPFTLCSPRRTITVMTRHRLGEDEKIRKQSLVAHFKDMEELLEQRQAAVNQEWGTLWQGWKDLKVKMSEVGMSAKSSSNRPVRLNVGGTEMSVPRYILEGMEESSAAWNLGDLFGSGVWDKRLPRDSDDQVFLDESPACFHHLLRESSLRLGKAGGCPDLAARDLPADELPYFPFVAGALLGVLPQPLPSTGTTVTVESTVLGASETDTLTATLLGWCPGKPKGLRLLYRASRDGWTDPAFRNKIGSNASTISLVRVKASGSEACDSVVGGFSSVPWNNIPFGRCVASPGAFVFMLKDGGESGPKTFRPARWGVRPGATSKVCCCEDIGFGFSNWSEDLIVQDRSNTLRVGSNTYEIPAESSFLALDKRTVVELEAFQVCSTAPAPPRKKIGKGLIDCAAISATQQQSVSTAEHQNDIHRFGASIAKSLKLERIALCQARTELVQANAKATASIQALVAVYGSEVARGKDDPVIEFSLGGTRSTTKMTTLLSTIQTCPPGSFLAVWFERWSRTGNDKDRGGSRQINDCSPAVFAKLLDVLRMRKRMGWDGGVRPVRVAIRASDRSSFETLVSTYFPGHESFIMECVEFQEEPPIPGRPAKHP